MRYFIYARKSSEGEERQVLSLASQQEALAKSFGGNTDIEIVGVYEEAKSAKTPGRALFAEMLRRIEAGEADGIASWAPDRLARNSIDGGHIIYLLDRGVLRDLKFATYTFENNSQGKFMLGIMFNQSKYYSDALSENVKRGNATKVAMGWRPNRAPLGYKNCPETKTTIPDPDQFPMIRRIFDLFLTGAYTPHQIVKVAQHDWGLLTPRMSRSGGRPIGRSSIYQTLSNPFYKGVIVWGGTAHPGRHEPMVTPKEFDKVQALLSRRSTPTPTRQSFAFSGIITCGKCGKAITAERKTNRYGTHYTYYHCAARGRISGGCTEPSVEEAELTQQFAAFIAAMRITHRVATWARNRLQTELSKAQANSAKFAAVRISAFSEIGTQLRELTSLRLRRMVSDEEFTAERGRLEDSRAALENAENLPSDEKVIELLNVAERVSIYALDWFNSAANDNKQKLLKILCSNLTLTGKKLCIEAVKPFFTTPEFAGFPGVLGVEDELRTITREGKRLLAALRDLQQSGKVRSRLLEFKELEALFVDQDHVPEVQREQEHGLLPPRLHQEKASRRSRPYKRR